MNKTNTRYTNNFSQTSNKENLNPNSGQKNESKYFHGDKKRKVENNYLSESNKKPRIEDESVLFATQDSNVDRIPQAGDFNVATDISKSCEPNVIKNVIIEENDCWIITKIPEPVAKKLYSEMNYSKPNFIKRKTRNSMEGRSSIQTITPKKNGSVLNFRCKKTPVKYGKFDDGRAIIIENGKERILSNHHSAEKGAVIPVSTPNSKTPSFIESPGRTRYRRNFVSHRLALYGPVSNPVDDEDRTIMSPIALKFDLESDEGTDSSDILDKNFKSDVVKRSEKSLESVKSYISWEGLKDSCAGVLESTFELGKKFQKVVVRRYKSQNQVMGTSAKNATADFLSEKDVGEFPNNDIIKKMYMSTLKEIGIINHDGEIIPRSTEFRHLAPFAVLGNLGQIPENMAAGPAHTNTVELCVELGLYDIAKSSVAGLTVEVKEYVYGKWQIGLFREYLITDNDTGAKAAVKFPVLCCLTKPIYALKDIMKQYIERQLNYK